MNRVYSGVVQQGMRRGRKLGFPTANIAISQGVEDGLYVGYSLVDGKSLPSLIFVGANITFNEREKKAEVHILEFRGDLYGQKLCFALVERLRENVKFDSVQALVEQMNTDLIAAKTYFTNNPDMQLAVEQSFSCCI